MLVYKSFITLFFLSLFSFTIKAQPAYVVHDCSNTITFPTNGTYQADLNHLLSSLSSNATRGNRFYNTTSGRNSDMVYGLFLCRGDVSNSSCGECVSTATKDITQRCPVEKIANPRNVADQERFNQILADTMDAAATLAVSARSDFKYFATREASISGFQTLYSLVQCTPDLSSGDCNACLRGAIAALPDCCSGKQGARVLKPSCNIRYEVSPFYNQTTVAAPAAPSLLTPPPPAASDMHEPIYPTTLKSKGGGGQLNSFTSLGDPTYLYHFCSNVTTFTRNSVYITNINNLFSYLTSNATVLDGFYKTTAGQNPNMIHGLFLCRGDVLPEFCQYCIELAATDVAQRCPNQTWAIIWYDECMLRYSNQSIVDSTPERPKVNLRNNIDVMEPDRFNQQVATLMKNIATRASNASLGAKKFATEEVRLKAFLIVYSLAQCTPDISSGDCCRCLENAIADLLKCCSGKTGVFALYPSCTVQYQLAPFYNSSNQTIAAPPPASPALPLLLSPPPPGRKGMSSQRVIKIVVPTVGFLVFSTLCVLGWKARKKLIVQKMQSGKSKARNMQSLQFDLSIVEAATNKFAEVNKIGAGGFGSVYKGTLPDGQEIAVKRLSTSSGQGDEEFQNEVQLVAKLQHRNLVKLYGYCLEAKERMLIYEFVPNRSLDYFIFDPEKQRQLDWPTRYKIIKGIARGLLYLHSDSHLKIVHRDLKASNILLDEDITPKISDFGMARIVGENKSVECTKRIVGTYGYMSPEYAMHGRFSEKSDVFSFGILILEIICAKMNTSFCHSQYTDNLLTHVWRHWKNGTPIDLMDSTLQDSYVSNEVLRCIQIGLLCVQEDPGARPTMARVVLMLSSSSVTLPSPQKTAFFFGTITGRKFSEQKSDRSKSTSSSATANEASISELFAR
ncbi:Cysteine-rich RLK 25 [Theobroma cacao]|uniref:Cysteine-rich RLK 25 n=1 Tax=Theobroma cacao TaxID=3641 RepID=A0A061GGL5_THECC|nr:Cysteine-rich RLK 25 [Theobroma cacao]